MTDLHCHILPGIDDGAKDTAVSLELLHREYEDGVRNIAFTSHFNSERTTVDAFTAKRQAAFEQLTAALEGQPMQFDFKLGAEVFFSPGLCELDTRALCMGTPLICCWNSPPPTSRILSGRPCTICSSRASCR